MNNLVCENIPSELTIWSPLFTNVNIVDVIAPIPDVLDMALSAFSSIANLASNSVRVGLHSLVYTYPHVIHNSSKCSTVFAANVAV